MFCRVAAVKLLPVYHHRTDYIIWSFESLRSFRVILKTDFAKAGVKGGKAGRWGGGVVRKNKDW